MDIQSQQSYLNSSSNHSKEFITIGNFKVHKSRLLHQHLKAKNLIKPKYRIPPNSRERATYIKLRKLGYTINAIASAFGRSTSLVHRVLKKATWILHTRKLRDLRKIPRYVREQHARWSPKTLQKYLNAWEAWILSEEGEPP